MAGGLSDLALGKQPSTGMNLLRDFKSYTAKQLLHLITTLPNESRSEWMLHHFNNAGKVSAQNKDFAPHSLAWPNAGTRSDICRVSEKK
jgi:hypothetical protein